MRTKVTSSVYHRIVPHDQQRILPARRKKVFYNAGTYKIPRHRGPFRLKLPFIQVSRWPHIVGLVIDHLTVPSARVSVSHGTKACFFVKTYFRYCSQHQWVCIIPLKIIEHFLVLDIIKSKSRGWRSLVINHLILDKKSMGVTPRNERVPVVRGILQQRIDIFPSDSYNHLEIDSPKMNGGSTFRRSNYSGIH